MKGGIHTNKMVAIMNCKVNLKIATIIHNMRKGKQNITKIIKMMASQNVTIIIPSPNIQTLNPLTTAQNMSQNS